MKIRSSLFLAFVILSYFVLWTKPTLDVTTIYRGGYDHFFNYTTAECHARTNALGLPFISPNGSFFEPQVGLLFSNCQIGLKQNCPWTLHSWDITGDSDLPLLNLPQESILVRTNGYSTSQIIPIFSSTFNFSLQTSTSNILRMFLLTEISTRSAEMYVIDITSASLPKKLQRSGIMKCGYGYEYGTDVDFGQDVGLKKCHNMSDIYIKWTEEKMYMFQMDTSNGILKLSCNGSQANIFNIRDTYPLKVNFVFVTSINVARDWTFILGARVWSLTKTQGIIKSPVLDVKKNSRICISFFSYMDLTPGSAILVSVHYNNDKVKVVNEILNKWSNAHKWTLQRVLYNFSVEAEVQILIEGLKGNPFGVVALHGLMGCNPDDNEDIALTRVSLDRTEPYICDVPTPIVSGPSCFK